MPSTSSAVPADLLRYESVAARGAAEVAAQARFVLRAGATLASSRSVGLGGVDLALLGRRLHRQADRVAACADRTGDVGHAFAAAGQAAWNPVAGAVVVADDLVARCLQLPDGRALSMSDLAAMSVGERLAWFLRLLASPVGSDDPSFRAIAGLLAAAAVAGPRNLFEDDAFLLADAAVLEAIQLGLVAASAGAGARWPASSRDPRSLAIAAWVAHAHATGDAQRDIAWAHAEELSVRYGESVVDQRGLRFGPAFEGLVRFAHVYRAAIERQEEHALLARTIASLDPAGLVRLAADVVDVVERRIEDLIDLPVLEPVFDWLRIVTNPFDPFDIFPRGLDRVADWVPLSSGVPPFAVVVEVVVEAVTPVALAAMVLDPAATPPALVAGVLDEVLGIVPPLQHPPAAYYVALLVDRGYLRGLPADLAEVPGAVPPLPGD